jgi:ribosomal 50S subunit-associated protein YjgA (DUF615 family)
VKLAALRSQLEALKEALEPQDIALERLLAFRAQLLATIDTRPEVRAAVTDALESVRHTLPDDEDAAANFILQFLEAYPDARADLINRLRAVGYFRGDTTGGLSPATS